MPNIHSAIQAMMQGIQLDLPGKTGGGGRKPVVCISRDYGAGGDEIAARLAAALGVGHYDSAILNKICERTHADPQAMKLIDEGASKARDMWLYSLVTGQDISTDTYKRHLVNVVLTLSRLGGVIVGRGAHIILANTGALRLRITGSSDACAKRAAAAEGLGFEAAKKRVDTINHERGKFVWDTFHMRLNDPHTFDMTLNTDYLGDEAALMNTLIDATTVFIARA